MMCRWMRCLVMSAILVGGCPSLSSADEGGRGKGETRPNFLIFIADDQGYGDLGSYGHPVLKTPHIDRLAREGMRFDRAFLTISSCSPSRASILTGRYPHRTGAEDLHQPLPANQKTIAQYLKFAGYHNMAVGKWHLGESEKKHWAKIVDCAGKATGQEAVKMLKQRPRESPFFFWVASKDPHRPFDKDAIEKRYDPAKVIVPPYLPDHPLIRQDIALYYGEISRFDEHVGQILAELKAQGELDDTFIVFMSDNGMPFPRAKTTLYDSGIRTPFIVRYPGLAAKGKSTAELVSVVDLAPTMAKLSEVKVDTMDGRDFSALLSDPDRENRVRGRSEIFAEANWHDFEKFTRAVRTKRYLLIRNYYWDAPLWNSVDSINSITWTGYLAMHRAGKLTKAQRFLFREPRPFEEFYDLQLDPNSLRNVVKNTRYSKEVNGLRRLLDNWRVDTHDRMPAKRRRDGWTRDGRPLPHNKVWYDRYMKAGGRSSFEKF